jgi:sulfonate transport system substrate-binding protein
MSARFQAPGFSRSFFPRRRSFAAVAIAAVVAGPLLAACGSSSGSSTSAGPATAAGSSAVNLSKVTLRVADQVKGTESRLEASGVLANLPYKIEWSEFAAAAPQLQAVRAGAADIGFAGDAPTLNAIGTGSDIKIVGAVRAVNDSGLALLVPKNSPVKTIADLKGKTVSPTTKGSIGHYLLLGALQKGGLTAKDVKVSYLPPAAASAAFSSGQLAAWAVWDPYTALAEAQGARVLATGTGISKGLGFLDASSKSLADAARRAAIADFIQRVAKSWTWANTNPVPFAQLYANLTKLPLPVATAVAKRSIYTSVPLDATVISDLQQEADVYTAAGVIPKKLDVSSAFDRTLN